MGKRGEIVEFKGEQYVAVDSTVYCEGCAFNQGGYECLVVDDDNIECWEDGSMFTLGMGELIFKKLS